MSWLIVLLLLAVPVWLGVRDARNPNVPEPPPPEPPLTSVYWL